MRSPTMLTILALAFAFAGSGCSCSDKHGDDDDVVSPWGLDERPSNPDCVAPERPPNASNVTTQDAFGGLTGANVLQLVQHPTDDDRWYAVLKGGQIQTFLGSNPVPAVALDIDAIVGGVANTDNEQGLFSLAFDPQFSANGYAFVSYTDNSGDTVIERYTSNDGITFDAASALLIFATNQPFANHNGGQIAFGPDDYLYIGLGDGGSANDPGNRAQNPQVPLGKILRIDVSNSTLGNEYDIPPTNPFAGNPGAGLEEIYAMGMRNPWRFSFDIATGDLWVGDVGQDAWEEVDIVELGGNYGWRDREGFGCNPNYGQPCDGPYLDPVVAMQHNYYNSMTGGFVYRGSLIPELQGKYIYADYSTGRVHALFFDIDGNPDPQELLNVGRVPGFGQGRDGEIYILDRDSGTFRQLVPQGPAPPNNFPQTLTATGCVDSADPTRFASGVIPYDIQQPFWSDGATKERGFAIPDGTTITIQSDGDWEFPIGSVLMKNFYMDGEIFETRLFIRHDDGGWAGYSYEWRDDKTDADLLPGGKAAQIGPTAWLYPDRATCLSCHTSASGRSLGLETAQMNHLFYYEATGRNSNELATLDHIGMFTDPLPDTPENLPVLPPAYGSDALEARTLAYFHTNCAMCHRPEAGQGPQNFLFGTSLADMNICNVPPENGDLGIAGANLVTPGDPSTSIISVRMKRTDANRMPNVGSIHVDPQGTALVDEWINSLSACP